MKKFLIKWKQIDRLNVFDRETKVMAVDEVSARRVFLRSFNNIHNIEIVSVIELKNEGGGKTEEED